MVGMAILKAKIAGENGDVWAGVRAYNGSGPEAEQVSGQWLKITMTIWVTLEILVAAMTVTFSMKMEIPTMISVKLMLQT